MIKGFSRVNRIVQEQKSGTAGRGIAIPTGNPAKEYPAIAPGQIFPLFTRVG
jgi:hypothetical protein